MLTFNRVDLVDTVDGVAKNYVEGACLSSDTKPTTGVANGSLLLEMNTSTLYMFDEAGNTWRAWE